MIRQYLVQVRDKRKTDFLQEYGDIIHVAKLTGIVVFETSDETAVRLENHPEVLEVRVSDDFSIAPAF